jgi:hypothetical protein
MSTKTTFKRVALVTVAALGFGMLSTVTASAAASTPTAVTVGTLPTAQVGVAHAAPITVTLPSGSLSTDTFAVYVRVTSAPAGSQFRSITGTPTLVSGAAATGNTVKAAINIEKATGNAGALGTVTQLDDGLNVGALFSPSNAQVVSTVLSAGFKISITPDVAGAYTVMVSTNGDADGTIDQVAYVAGDAVATYTFTTASSPASVVLAAVTGAGIAGSATGMLFSATIKDAAGATAQLGVNETIGFALTAGAGTVTVVGISAVDGSDIGTASATYSATNANFTNGVGYFRFKNSAAETAVITATGTALLSPSVTGTLSFTTRTETSATSAVITDSTTQAAAILLGAGGRSAVTGAYAQTVSRAATSHSYKVTYTGAAAIVDGTTSYDAVAVVDTSGKITGIVGGTYTVATAISASVATTLTVGDTSSISITATLSTAGNSFTATIGGSTLTVTSAAPVVTAITVTPAGPIRQTVGSSTAITAKVTDQFGAAVALSAVNASTTGRNASTSATALVSDASGYVTYTRADAGTAATVLVQDTVTFTSGSVTSVTDALVINYGTTTVGTVTCTSGAELDTATSVTYRDISSSDGAEEGAASLCTVTVKDANGAIMVGVPVTVTTASAGAAVLSTSATLYTGSAGTVAPSVYAWTSGAKTFTVTAGTVTSTETVNYRQATATEVRSISVAADGNRHLVTAKDRFGNVVPGVHIYGTRTGSGLFGGGTPTASAITASPVVVDSTTGVAEFIFNGGSTTSVVTYQVASAANTPSATYGYTDALAGNVDGGTDPDALTATVAGTALVAEEGVGASFSAAGVNSVSATIAADTTVVDTAQAAVDAAAEATDAANAATDAANAAAEAADAATAAAQDAADAVAALSAQVASLISGLKSQLTALTNLVIKIQKKVKA